MSETYWPPDLPSYDVWRAGVPAIVAELERRWAIRVEDPFPEVWFNYVAPAVRADGTHAVLKVMHPKSEEYLGEPAMLVLCDGDGMVRVLERAPDLGAILLERLEPGTPLVAMSDDEAAARIAATIMRRIHRPVPPQHPFVTAEYWGRAFGRHRERHGGSGVIPAAIFELGERLYIDLLATAASQSVIHGDLHQGNILAAQREPWLAIDPKGIVGEPAFDTPPFIYNTWNWVLQAPDPAAILRRRVEILAEELSIPVERIRDWTIARCVLSAIWSLEDEGEFWEDVVAVAELLAAARR